MAPLFHGIPAAPGASAGTARILRSPADVRNVVAGDVLICPTASAAWSAVFPLARALVTDTGGALSQAATIAREFGIPAVVGTGEASVLIRDGDSIRVLGDEGVVEALVERTTSSVGQPTASNHIPAVPERRSKASRVGTGGRSA